MSVPSVKILMSGLIRPTPDDVIGVVQTMKRQIPNATVFLCTWTGHVTDALRACVDHCFEIPEPTEVEIDRVVHARTIQQRQLGEELRGWTYAIYRMVYGVRMVCEFAKPYVNENDIVIRIRTDTPFVFESGYLDTIFRTIENDYWIRPRKSGGGFDDWFAITRFHILQKTWTFQDYNSSVARAWNAEDLIRRNLTYPLKHLDDSKIECYIIRLNGKRDYHK